MALYLDVPYHRQDSPMSCWWAAIRMALAYANGSAPAQPSSFSPAFSERRPTDVLMDPGRRAITSPLPGEWYQLGVPRQSIMLDSSDLERLFDPNTGRMRGLTPPLDTLLLSRVHQGLTSSGFRHEISPSLREITRFSSVAAPTGWSSSTLETMLRAHGPIVQFSTLRGTTGNYGHAFLIIGVGPNEAYIHDPAQMSWLSVSLNWLNTAITTLRQDMFSPAFAMPLLAHSQGGSINRTLAAPKAPGS